VSDAVESVAFVSAGLGELVTGIVLHVRVRGELGGSADDVPVSHLLAFALQAVEGLAGATEASVAGEVVLCPFDHAGG
jgi:hypothetical protein